MKIFWTILIVTCLLLWVVTPLSAAMYRWKDENGQLHYATNPPMSPVGKVEIKRNNRWYPYTGQEKPELKRTGTPSQTVVTYSKQNAVIIVQVTINNTITRPFAVDTGASYTVISQEIANALSLAPNPRVPPVTLQTANGQIQAPLVNLDAVTVGELTTHNVTAAIHNVHDSSNIAGLLGLSFLNRFKITFDSTNSQFILTPISSSSDYKSRDCVTAREFVMQGQSLNDGSEDEARYYRKAISLCPDFVDAHYYLGAVYFQQKHYYQAIDIHLEIVRLQPDDPQAHYRLGVLYILTRNIPLAKNEFQTTLRLDPNHNQAKEYLEQLKNY